MNKNNDEVEAAAVRLFNGNEWKARSWMKSSNKVLSDRSPYECIAAGNQEEVMCLIRKIEHGEFS